MFRIELDFDIFGLDCLFKLSVEMKTINHEPPSKYLVFGRFKTELDFDIN